MGEHAIATSTLLVTSVFLVLLGPSTVSAEVQPGVPEYGTLDDGTRGERVLVDSTEPLRHEWDSDEIDDCGPGQYELDNNTCAECLEHDAHCSKSRQCCSVPNMACWQYHNRPPMCKCNRDYGWDSELGQCYLIPVPMVLVVTAYTALGAACLVGLVAILVQLCKFCKGQYMRCRYGDPYAHRSHLRGGRRHDPRAPRQRRLSSLVPPDSTSPPLSSKPPNYEDVFGLPTISQSITRRPTGSIRSLPPAYSLADPSLDSAASQSTISNTIEITVTSEFNEPRSLVVVDLTQSHASNSTPDSSGGEENPSFLDERHI